VTITPSMRWIVRWLATTAMMSVVFLLPGHHWSISFLWLFAVGLFMNRRNIRAQ
jgi:hypothetical protein